MIHTNGTNVNHRAALAYAELGYPVFPCAPNKKFPATPHGCLDASQDPEQIEAWWTENPAYNVAIATNGLCVLDSDGKDNPYLATVPADDLLIGPCHRTPREGLHYFYRQNGTPLRNTTSTIAPKVDTRADGGYVLVPPSVVDGKPYHYVTPLDVPPEQLPTVPTWLVEALLKPPKTATPTADPEGKITEGQRNDWLYRRGCALRGDGLVLTEIIAALHSLNRRRCNPPVADAEIERIAGSAYRREPNPSSEPEPEPEPIRPLTVRQLIEIYPRMRAPNIYDLLREGETMNVISGPKVGKSWLVSDLALCKATGRSWLSLYEVVRGPVLIIDNELHGETTAHRLPKVADARGIPAAEYLDAIQVVNLRGRLTDILGIGAILKQYPEGALKNGLIIIDAFYRCIPRGTDENDNGAVAGLYNVIDAYALRLGCSFALVHHSTKGSQSGKAVTDVGAGAGSQARATDTHLVLRQHAEAGAYVLDAAVRSWAPIEPRVLRWAWPVWHLADDLDPADLKPDRPTRRKAKAETETQAEPTAPREPDWTPERFTNEFLRRTPESKHAIIARAMCAGLTENRAAKLFRIAHGAGMFADWPTDDKRIRHYSKGGDIWNPTQNG